MPKSPHKKEQDGHQEAATKLSALMDSMPDFLCFKDGEGRWLEANAFALKVFLLENVDYKGKKNTELVSPDHLFYEALKECDISDEAAWQKGTWRGEEIIPQPEGGAFVFDVMKVPSFHPDGSRKALTIVGRDITEQKRIEENLRFLVNNNPLPLVLVDWETGKYLYANQRVCELFETTRESIIGSKVVDRYINPQDREDAMKLLGERGHYNGLEVRFKTFNGREIWVEINMILTSYCGKPVIQTVFADITKRKQVEQALRESEERHRSILQKAMDGYWKVDTQKRLMEVNEAYCKMSGYSAGELMTMRIPDLEANETPEEAAAHAQKIMALGEDRFESRHRRKDGSIFDVEVSVQYRHNENHFAVFLHDITERKQAEQKLEQSEKKARHLNELLRAMYDIQHLIRNEPDEGKFLGGVCNVLVETRGYLAAWVGVPQPDSRQVVAVAHAGRAGRILKEAPITWDDTPNGRGPCGTAVREWIPCVISDIATDPRFEPWRKAALAAGCGSVASFPILTEKRLWGVITIKANRPNAFSEEEIELLTDLASEVGQALQSIEHRKERKRMEETRRQEQKMVAIGQLAGGVAHDFNNIMGASMLQIGLLKECPDLTPEIQRGLEELEQGALRASSLTRQLLMFSRKQAVQMKPLEMNGVLDSVHGMLSRILGETILLKVQTDAKPMWVKADHGMIEQVIVNLCVNARDAMPNRGKLTLRVEKLEIEAGNQPAYLDVQPGRFVCLSVADTGTGIAPEDLKHIFEPFYTTKEVGKGTGLGLATVHGIVQQHGGWIDVESKVGKGTVFRVHLPFFAGGQEQPAKSKDNQVPKGRETILLVEDDAMLLRSVASGLKLLGYRVVEAVDGVDALLKWQEHSGEIDLVLTDMVMPGEMSGLELAQRILGEKPGFKIVISSGYSNELNNLNQELRRGITLLPKPYGIPLLAKTIRQCLDASEPG